MDFHRTLTQGGNNGAEEIVNNTVDITYPVSYSSFGYRFVVLRRTSTSQNATAGVKSNDLASFTVYINGSYTTGGVSWVSFGI